MADMTDDDLLQLTNNPNACYALYKLPNEDSFQLVLQKNNTATLLSNNQDYFSTNGFVIKAFGNSNPLPSVAIQPDFVKKFELINFKIADRTYSSKFEQLKKDENAKKQHLKVLNTAKKALLAGQLEKVVMARRVAYPKPAAFNTLTYFITLCKKHPSTFCYLFSLPSIGLWIGASPELLIKLKDNTFETTSLAGTIDNTDSSKQWRPKEDEEQQFVSEHIEDSLKKFSFTKFVKSQKSQLKMGNIAHLQNTYKVEIEGKKADLPALLFHLEPTPAVSGTPKNEAIQFIEKTEIDSRKYYTGFLGPANLSDNTQFYVNLRCLEITENKLNMYVGGGITSASDPAEEWIETCLKADTLLSYV